MNDLVFWYNPDPMVKYFECYVPVWIEFLAIFLKKRTSKNHWDQNWYKILYASKCIDWEEKKTPDVQKCGREGNLHPPFMLHYDANIKKHYFLALLECFCNY